MNFISHFLKTRGRVIGATCALVACLFSVQLLILKAAGVDDFVTTWETTTPNEAITIPTYANGNTYNYNVDWGDGQVSLGMTGSAVHTYATPGIYEVRIEGVFPQLYLYGDNTQAARDNAAKLLTIEQWGTGTWSSFHRAFYAASNVVSNATDVPDLSMVMSLASAFNGASAFNADLSEWNVSTVSDFSAMFAGASSFNGNVSTWNMAGALNTSLMFDGASSFNQNIAAWNMSGVTNTRVMFRNAVAFNQPIGTWNVSSVTDMDTMFYGATNFNQNLGAWDVRNVLDMNNMFRNVTLSTANYDALLQGWAAQVVEIGVPFTAGGSQYCATTERNTLATTYSWSIVDGGEAAGCATLPSGGLEMELSDSRMILEDFYAFSIENNLFSGKGGILPSLLVSGTNESPVVVTFSIGGSATVGSDYTQSGTFRITIPAGTYNQSYIGLDSGYTFNIIQDTVVEPNETVTFTVSSVTGEATFADLNNDGNIASTTFTYTIYNDDDEISQSVATPSAGYELSNLSTSTYVTIDFSDYELVLEDNFIEKPTTDYARGVWSARSRWADQVGNGPVSAYLYDEMRDESGQLLSLDPFSIEDGELVIRAKRIPSGQVAAVRTAVEDGAESTIDASAVEYYTGSISTKESWGSTYGYYEIRAKMPEGRGHWPAFWLTASTQGWPPEIDVFEFLGRENSRLHVSTHYDSVPPFGSGAPSNQLLRYNPHAFHFETGAPQPNSYKTATRRAMTSAIYLDEMFGADFNAFDNYYTYAMEWGPEDIIFYFGLDADRLVEVWRMPTPEDVKTPMYVINNNQIGGNWPYNPLSADDATVFADDNAYYTDYIKIYSRRPTSTTIAASGGSATGGAEPSIMNGTAASEVFTPGFGLDYITLGGGEDAVVVSLAPKFTENNKIIYGFGGDDVIVIDGFDVFRDEFSNLENTADVFSRLFQVGNDVWLRLGLDEIFSEFNAQTIIFKDTDLSIFAPESFQFDTYNAAALKADEVNHATQNTARQAALSGGVGQRNVTHGNIDDIDISLINDAFEKNTATLKNIIVGNNAYNSLATHFSGSEIVSFNNVTEVSVGEDINYNYPLGLFTVAADIHSPIAVGTTETFTMYLDDEYDTSLWTVRARSNGTYNELTSATFATSTIEGQTLSTVTFSIVDAGIYDTDTATSSVAFTFGLATEISSETDTTDDEVIEEENTGGGTGTSGGDSSGGGTGSSGGGSSSGGGDVSSGGGSAGGGGARNRQTASGLVTNAIETLALDAGGEHALLRRILIEIIRRTAGSLTISTNDIAPAATTFNKNLKVGMTDGDVVRLQRFLNQRGFAVGSNNSPGSTGNETNYFGELTREALARFQFSYRIEPAWGFFGSITRSLVNSLLR